MIRFIRSRLRLLGAEGAANNARVAVLERQRHDQAVNALAARIQHPSMRGLPRGPTAA